MAQGKKISELNEVSSVTDNDEFLFVDKEGSGANSGVGGKTAKIKFSDLKSAIGAGETGAKGASGDKGMKGEPGPRGLDGAGTQYWTQSPTDGDAVYYDAGNVGIGTDAPVGKLHIETSDDGTALGPDVILMRESTNPVAGGLLGNLRFQGRTHSANGAIKVEYADIKAEIVDPAGGGKLVFRTRQENSGNHHTMVLDNNGNVGIGPLGASSNAGDMLHISTSELQCGLTLHAETKQAKLVANSAGSLALKAGNGGNATEANMSFEVNGAEAMRINNAGNVGIGTTNPTYAKLVVRGGGGYDDITSQPMKTQLEVFTSDEATAIQSIQRDNNNAPSDIHFWGNDFIFRSVNGTGNVGIGTDSPTSMLDIQTDTTDAVPVKVQSMHPNQTGLRLTNGAGDTASTWTMMSKSYGDTLSPSSLAFMHGTSAPSQENQTLVLTPTGNVGIGTSSPRATLQVETENSTLYNLMPTIQNVTGCFRNKYSNGIKAGTHTGLQLNVYGNDDESMDLTDMQNQNVLGYVGIVAEEDNTNKGSLVFHSSPNGTNREEGMRLASNNNLGIGTKSPKAIVSIRGNNSGNKARVSFLGDGNGVIGSVRGEVVAKVAPDPVNNPGGTINTKGDLTFHTNSYSQVVGGTYSDDVEKEAFRLTTDGGMVHTASGFYRSRAARFFNTTNDNTKKDREIKFYVGADMNYRIKITIDGLAPFNYNGTAFFKEYEIVGQTETVEGMHYGHLLEHRELQASNLHTDAKPDFYELKYHRLQDGDTWVFWISVKVRFQESYVANARVEGYMNKATQPNQQNRTIIHGSSQVDTLDGFGIVPIVEDGTDNVQSPEELQYPTTKSTDK